jgi:hypothetical protein
VEGEVAKMTILKDGPGTTADRKARLHDAVDRAFDAKRVGDASIKALYSSAHAKDILKRAKQLGFSASLSGNTVTVGAFSGSGPEENEAWKKLKVLANEGSVEYGSAKDADWRTSTTAPSKIIPGDCPVCRGTGKSSVRNDKGLRPDCAVCKGSGLAKATDRRTKMHKALDAVMDAKRVGDMRDSDEVMRIKEAIERVQRSSIGNGDPDARAKISRKLTQLDHELSASYAQATDRHTKMHKALDAVMDGKRVGDAADLVPTKSNSSYGTWAVRVDNANIKFFFSKKEADKFCVEERAKAKDGFRPRTTPAPKKGYESFMDTVKRLKESKKAEAKDADTHAYVGPASTTYCAQCGESRGHANHGGVAKDASRVKDAYDPKLEQLKASIAILGNNVKRHEALAKKERKAGNESMAKKAEEAAANYRSHLESARKRVGDAVPAAQFLVLNFDGMGKRKVPVDFADNAVKVFRKYVEDNGFGASDMGIGCGDLVDAAGKKIGQVMYNGAVRAKDSIKPV